MELPCVLASMVNGLGGGGLLPLGPTQQFVTG